MARTRNRTTQQTIKVDAIDQLTEKLSTSGVAFVRDAWLNKAPDNYGVVELQGEQRQLWADGKLLDSVYRVLVTLYVGDDNDDWAYTVQDLLEELEADGKVDLTHTISRTFAYDIAKVQWTWTIGLYGPLTWEEPAPEPQPEPTPEPAEGDGQ